MSSQSLGPLLIEHIGASLSGPLLNDGSREQVTVNETKAPSRRRISIKKAVVNALKEVEDAHIAVQKSREQRAAQER